MAAVTVSRQEISLPWLVADPLYRLYPGDVVADVSVHTWGETTVPRSFKCRAIIVRNRLLSY